MSWYARLHRPTVEFMDTTFASALTGFLTGAALIIAIGAQNVFVLRQGISKSHVLPVVAICAVSDALLIGAGVAGMGRLVEAMPALVTVARALGAAFLAAYGLMAVGRVLRPGQLNVNGGQATSLRAAILTCLAFTWLNPHVYLDTLVFLGSVASTHREQWAFGAGAMAASLTWFAGLGYGARLLAPLFSRARAWQVLDGLIAVVMLAMSASLLLHR